MYDTLTTSELTVLQSMLFEGTEEAYRLARIEGDAPGGTRYYRRVHSELGHLFIEAGTELLMRLDTELLMRLDQYVKVA